MTATTKTRLRPYVAKGSSKRKRCTVQTLGPHTYALPDLAPSTNTDTNTIVTICKIIFLSCVGIIVIPCVALFMCIIPKAIKHKLLGKLIPSIMKNFIEKHSYNQRTLLLQHVYGRVLDIGSGGGSYLKHLKRKDVSHVVCLEPLITCHETIRQAARDAGFSDDTQKISIVGETIETYHKNHNNNVQEESFDWIILGNVLCEIVSSNSEQHVALEKINDLLKPGGYIYFCEHVCSPRGTWKRMIQKLVWPLWKYASGGCHVHYDTLDNIECTLGDRYDIISWEMTHIDGPLGSTIYMGLARKVVME